MRSSSSPAPEMPLVTAESPLKGNLVWLVRILWSPVASVRLHGGPPLPGFEDIDTFAVLPNLTTSTLLLPLDSRAAAAASVRRYSDAMSWPSRLQKRAVGTGLRLGIVQPFLRHQLQVAVPAGATAVSRVGLSLKAHLEDVLAEPDLHMAVALGPPRANRKPVLQLVTGRGRTVGFVKVGWTPLTRRLVRGEAEILTSIGREKLLKLVPPQLLYSGQWQGLELSVVSPLRQQMLRSPGSIRRPRLSALRELSSAFGGTQVAPLAASSYWERTRCRVESSTRDPDRPLLDEIVDHLEQRYGEATLVFGAWHGDFSPWNLSSCGRKVMVWDWERCSADVPVGFDLLHFHLQAAYLLHGKTMEESVTSSHRRARRGLTELGVAADCTHLVLLLYLIELYLRCDEDRAADEDDILLRIRAGIIRVFANQLSPGPKT